MSFCFYKQTDALAYCANKTAQEAIGPFPPSYASEVKEVRYLGGGAIFKIVGYWKVLLIL